MTAFEILVDDPAALLLSLGLGYLLGSVPFGLVLTRLAGLGDVRAIGSGNIGATNVLRTGRRDIAAATLLLVLLKGTAAVVIAASVWNGTLGAAAGAAAFLGHLFPAWLAFRGGKGVATFLGVSLGLSWAAALTFALVWLGVAAVFRYSSLAALTASVAASFVALVGDEPFYGMTLWVLAAILWLRHRTNIARLIAGSERRIGGRG